MLCCLYIPDFIAQAILRSEPALRRRAVAVLEGAGDPTSPLQRVCGMNEAARVAGIECGMAKLQVEATFDVALRRRSPAQEAAAHAALLDCAHAFSPRVEPLAPDTVLADLSGLERLFGPLPKMAQELARRAAALGLEANVAVAENREAAVHAARGLPGVTVIPPGEEGRRLGPLPVDVLFAGPDASLQGSPRRHEDTKECKIPNAKFKNPAVRGYRESARPDAAAPRRSAASPSDSQRALQFLETLDRWGVHNLRAFAALPTVAVSERLGQEGVRLQKLARGEGSQEMAAAEPPLRFEEAIELEHPVAELEPLAFLLARLLEQLCARLAARALATNELRLALTLDSAVRDDNTENPPQRHGDTEHNKSSHGFTQIDTDEITNQKSQIKHPSEPLCLRGEGFSRTLRLPVPMLDAKVFLKLLQLDLQQHPPGAPVIGVALAAEPVRPQVAQHGLFQAATPAPEKLQLMLARLAGIVGDDNVGSPQPLDTHRRDTFRMRAYAHSADTETRQAKARGKGQKAKISLRIDDSARTAVRLFRPPLAATVEVHDGKPVRLACAGERGERDAVLAGDIVWAAGPWRASGNWWKEAVASAEYRVPSRSNHSRQVANTRNSVLATRYSREEWDIAVATVSGTVLCRLVRDLQHGQWLVEGSYD